MRNNLVLLACVVVSSATAYGPKWHEIDDTYTFERYVRDFQKSYETDEERDLRRLVFEDRLRKIRAHNASPKVSYRMGVNVMSDRKEAERRTRGVDKSLLHPQKP